MQVVATLSELAHCVGWHGLAVQCSLVARRTTIAVPCQMMQS
uniref:Uncharacterized protein n=1 Tax=Anguilla anguilla TaxID=7936 RepID=A0A0E9VU01_ANGAN